MAVSLALVLLGCSSQPLQPWHTEKLDEEFTTRKADTVQSFDDYLALEDQLFRQLDENVYAQTETGPEHRLDRYSSGSLSDPRTHEPNWNRSFELPVENPRGGALMIHGMSDSPYSMRALALALHERGYWVVGLRSPGHGTAPSGLRRIRVEDMAAAVRIGMARLDERTGGAPVHMVGYSTGAALAIEFALDALEGETGPVPASLVMISPAIGIHSAAAMARTKDRLSGLPGLSGMAFTQIQPEFDPYSYNSFATNAADVVHRLTRSNARRLEQREAQNPPIVLPPVLALKSTVDATVTTEAVIDDLFEHLKPGRHELLLFDINRHLNAYRIMIDDPAPLTERIVNDDQLTFTVSLVTNEEPESRNVVSRRKPAGTAGFVNEYDLGIAWPERVISLSHIALPFPPDDPIYGQQAPDEEDVIFLGQLGIQGERGLLNVPEAWMVRLRYNPFYDYMEQRTLDWIDASNDGQSLTAMGSLAH